MIDQSSCTVEIRCDFLFNGVHYTEANGFNKYTIFMCGYADSTAEQKRLRVNVNGTNANDYTRETTIYTERVAKRWMWVKDAAGAPVDGPNGYHKFEYALNISVLQGSNDQHLAGGEVDVHLEYQSGSSTYMFGVSGNDLIIPGEIKDLALDCVSTRDDDGNHQVLVYYPTDLFKTDADLGYFGKVDLHYIVTHVAGDGTQTNATGNIPLYCGDATADPSLCDGICTASGELLLGHEEDDTEYVVIPVGAGNGTAWNCSGIFTDLSLACFDNLHMSFNLTSSSLTSQSCETNEVVLECNVGDIQAPTAPILKWSHLANDFIITLPYDSSMPTPETNEKAFEKITMYNIVNGQKVGMERLSDISLTDCDQYTDVSLSIFAPSGEYIEYDGYTYGISSENPQDVELVWACPHNDAATRWGKQVLVVREIVYVDCGLSLISRCTKKVESNIVIPFTEHLCDASHNEMEKMNYTELKDVFHRVAVEADGLGFGKLGNPGSSAPVSVVYGVMPKVLAGDTGIGPADSYEMVFVGNDGQQHVAEVHIIMESLYSDDADENDAIKQQIGSFVKDINVWHFEDIQNSDCVKKLFTITDISNGNATVDGATSGDMLVKAFVKLDLGVKYDVGIYTHHSMTSFENEDGTYTHPLEDVNCNAIEIMFEPFDVNCNYVDCSSGYNRSDIEKSWALNLVRYEQISAPTDVSILFNEAKSMLHLNKDASCNIQIDTTWGPVVGSELIDNDLVYTVSLYDDEISLNVISETNLSTDYKHSFVFKGALGEDIWGSHVYAIVKASLDLSGSCSVNTCYSLSNQARTPEIMVLKAPECLDCSGVLTSIKNTMFAEELIDSQGNVTYKYKDSIYSVEGIVANDNSCFVSFNDPETNAADKTSGEYEHIVVSHRHFLGSVELTNINENNTGLAIASLPEEEINTIIDYRVETTVTSNDGASQSVNTNCVMMKVRVSKLTGINESDVLELKSLDSDNVLAEFNLSNTAASLPTHIKLSQTEIEFIVSHEHQDIVKQGDYSALNRTNWTGDYTIDMAGGIPGLNFEDTENTLFTFTFVPKYTLAGINATKELPEDFPSKCVYPTNDMEVSLITTGSEIEGPSGEYLINTGLTNGVTREIRPLDNLPELNEASNLLSSATTTTQYFTQDPLNGYYEQTFAVQNNNIDLSPEFWSVKQLLISDNTISTKERDLILASSGKNVYKLVIDNAGLPVDQLNQIQLQARAQGTKPGTNMFTAVQQLGITTTANFVSSNDALSGITYEIIDFSGSDMNGSDSHVKICWVEEEWLTDLADSLSEEAIVIRSYEVALKDQYGNYIKSQEVREVIEDISSTGIGGDEHCVTLEHIFKACLMNNVNVEEASNKPLILTGCITTEYTIDVSGGSKTKSVVDTKEFNLRISRAPHKPCNVTVESEDCYSDHPTARLMWYVEDDRYTTESFTVYVKGHDKVDCSNIDASFTLMASDFNRLNEDALYNNTGKRSEYSYLMKLNGSEHEDLAAMFKLTEVKVERNIDLQQYTTNGAQGPVNDLTVVATGTDVLFDYQPNINTIELTDASLCTTYDSGSGVNVIHMLTYQNGDCLKTVTDLSGDVSGCNGSICWPIPGTAPSPYDDWKAAFEAGAAQYTVILTNDVGASVGKYKDDATLMNIAIAQNNAPTRAVAEPVAQPVVVNTPLPRAPPSSGPIASVRRNNLLNRMRFM